jgi:glycosyltransferase involved in cell wall biosynthesis
VGTIVLVAYYYPPLGGVGSQRALSFARHLPALGHDVVVVTPKRGAYGLDASLPNDDALPGVRVVRTNSFEPAVLARRMRRGKASASAAGDMVESASVGRVGAFVRGAVRKALYFPDHARGWIGPATRAAKKAARETNAVAIVSTSPPVSGHVAAVKAAKSLGLPAVLDFRDLWTAHRDDADTSARAESERRLEHELLHDASAVTTVSDACRKWLLARYGTGPAKPFRVLRNAFEEDDFADAPPPRERGVFRIVHAGTVYGAKQDTTAFFRALAKVRAAGAFDGRRVEVVLAGKVDAHAVDAARAAGCADVVALPGFVTHAESLRLLRSATVNLLLTWSEPGPVADGVCPGKMYEQMAAGRPVLALALPTCEAVSLLRESGGALVADPHDEPAIADALARLAAADRAGDAASAVPPRAASIDRFSRRSVARELAQLLASLPT